MQMQPRHQYQHHSMAGAASMGFGGMNDTHDVGDMSSMRGMGDIGSPTRGAMGSPIMRSQMAPPMGPPIGPSMGRIDGMNNMMGGADMGMNVMGGGIGMGMDMNMNGMNTMGGGGTGMGMGGMNSMGMSSNSTIMGGMVGTNLHSIGRTGIGTGAFNIEDPISRDMELHRLRQLQQLNMLDQQSVDRWTMPSRRYIR